MIDPAVYREYTRARIGEVGDGVMLTRGERFEGFLARIEDAGLRDIARHWNDARQKGSQGDKARLNDAQAHDGANSQPGSRRMAAWRDIDPSQIKRHLPIIWVWRYDRVANEFIGKLSGEAINLALRRSLRGVPMQEFFAADSYDAIFARCHRVVTEPCFSRDSGPVYIHRERTGTGERIILPLADDGETGDGIIGATVYDLKSASGTHLPHAQSAQYFSEQMEYYQL